MWQSWLRQTRQPELFGQCLQMIVISGLTMEKLRQSLSSLVAADFFNFHSISLQPIAQAIMTLMARQVRPWLAKPDSPLATMSAL